MKGINVNMTAIMKQSCILIISFNGEASVFMISIHKKSER